MSILGDDGRGFELARKLESIGVWRTWLGDALYYGFVQFLSSPSSCESFMRTDELKSKAQIHLQLRTRALLFDKASVSLFLKSTNNPSPSAAVSKLNPNFTWRRCVLHSRGHGSTKRWWRWRCWDYCAVRLILDLPFLLEQDMVVIWIWIMCHKSSGMTSFRKHDSALPPIVRAQDNNKLEFRGVLDSLPQARNAVMIERLGISVEQGESFHRRKSGSGGNIKTLSQEQALQMSKKVVAHMLNRVGFDSASEASVEVFSQLFECHLSKLGHTLRVLADSYRKQCSAIELIKMFLQTAGHSEIDNISKGLNRPSCDRILALLDYGFVYLFAIYKGQD